jgi:hypothetical protein
MIQRTINCGILLLLFGACHQTSKPIVTGAYTIDPSIKSEVEAHVQSARRMMLSSMDFRLHEDDSVVADTYASGKPIKECMTMATLNGDTIHITVLLGISAAFGYQIALVRDTAVVRHVMSSDAPMYKQVATDTLTFGLEVPCIHYTLTLAERPVFKTGAIVEGKIDLTSTDFYEVANGQQHKLSMQLTSYFKTEPLASDTTPFR